MVVSFDVPNLLIHRLPWDTPPDCLHSFSACCKEMPLGTAGLAGTEVLSVVTGRLVKSTEPGCGRGPPAGVDDGQWPRQRGAAR